jgi:hypothetical protein
VRAWASGLLSLSLPLEQLLVLSIQNAPTLGRGSF